MRWLRLRDDVALIHGVDSAIVVHQYTLGVDSTVMYDILCTYLIAIKVSKVVADLNGVFRPGSLYKAVGSLAISRNNYILLD